MPIRRSPNQHRIETGDISRIDRPIVTNTNDVDPNTLSDTTLTLEQYKEYGGMVTGNWVEPLSTADTEGDQAPVGEVFGPDLRIIK